MGRTPVIGRPGEEVLVQVVRLEGPATAVPFGPRQRQQALPGGARSGLRFGTGTGCRSRLGGPVYYPYLETTPRSSPDLPGVSTRVDQENNMIDPYTDPTFRVSSQWTLQCLVLASP